MKKHPRRAVTAAVATILAVGVATVITPSAAQAHGAMMKPGARTYLCWQDGLTETGEIRPPWTFADGQTISQPCTSP